MNYRSTIPLLLICTLFQAGCSNQAAYTGESFSNDSPFKVKVDSDVDTACESVRRSLLGQGYLIDLASSEEVKGRKAARGEGKQNAFIEMNVVCVPERSGSTIFATGVVSTYALKTNTSSASVGLSALGSISLPIGQSADSLVKVSEETIDDKEFYKRFFAAVDTVLGEMEGDKAAEEPVVEPVVEPTTPDAASPKTQPRIWPELFPEQGDPEVAPESSLGQDEPGIVPASPSGQVEPEIVPEPFPQQSAPVTTMESLLKEEPVGITPAPAPDDEPLGIPPAPAPDEEPLGIPPAPAPGDEPRGIPPATPSTGEAPGLIEPELVPVQVTAEKKAMPKPAAVVKDTSAAEPADPAARIEELF